MHPFLPRLTRALQVDFKEVDRLVAFFPADYKAASAEAITLGLAKWKYPRLRITATGRAWEPHDPT